MGRLRFICFQISSIYAICSIQEIHFYQDTHYLPVQLQNNLKTGSLSAESKILLEMFDAKPAQGNAYINNKELGGWVLNTEETVFEVVQYIIKSEGSVALVPLTCLAREDGRLIKSTLWKEEMAIQSGRELWSFLCDSGKGVCSSGTKVLNQVSPPYLEQVNSTLKTGGTERELRQVLETLFDRLSREKRIGEQFRLTIEWNYRGSRKRAKRFENKMIQELGKVDQ